MTTVLGVPGRFGDVSLHRSDIRAAAAPQPERSSLARTIERIWDRIRDWFCSSDVRAAKKRLVTLYDPNTSDRDKVASYFALKSMVGDGYVDRFRIEPAAFGYVLRIDYGAGISSYAHSIELCSGELLAAKLNEDISDAAKDPDTRKNYEDELARDLARCTFSINGAQIPDLAPDVPGQNGKLENLRASLSGMLNTTPGQLSALEAISYQKLFAMMIQSTRELLGDEITFDLIQISGDGEIVFDFSQKGTDVELHASFSSHWQSAGQEKRTTFLLHPAYDSRILVAPDGSATVTSAVCGLAPG